MRGMIYVECKPDAILVQTLTGLSRKEVIHEIKGKFGVVNQVNRRDNCKGLVDEDPRANQPEYLTRLQLREDLPARGLRLLRDSRKSNYIILLCPRLEEWIVRATRDSGLDLRSPHYNLPSDPVALHRVINVDLLKFQRLVEDLKDSDRLRSLRRLLNL